MKKILAVVLVLVFVVTMCSVSAGAIHYDDSMYDDWERVPAKYNGYYLYGGSTQVKNFNYTGYGYVDSSSMGYYTDSARMVGTYGDNTLSCCYYPELVSNSRPGFFTNDGNYNYLFKTTSGYMKVVNYTGFNYFQWFSYDNTFKPVSKGKINLELPLFLCACSNDNYYFVLEGDQTSSRGSREDLKGEEVYRLCVYNKSWGKVKSISVHDNDGYNTYNNGFTFSLGGTSMTESNGFLFVHNTVSSYGAQHQAGIILTFDIQKLIYVNDWAVCESNSIQGSGHILGGKIYTDKNGNIIKMHHQDAVDRGLVFEAVHFTSEPHGSINDCSGKYCNKLWTGGFSGVNIFPWKGTSGLNYTGAMVGDTNGSDKRYFCSFSSVTQNDAYSSNKDYNAYLSTMYYANSGLYKTGFYAETGLTMGDLKFSNQKLTNYTNDSGKFASNPHIIKFNDNKFAIMWAEMLYTYNGIKQSGNVSYAFFDRYGTLISSVKTVKGYISEVCPVVSGSKAVWYVEREGVNYFYTFTDAGTLTETKGEDVTINYLYTPKNVKCSTGYNACILSWDKVDGASQYKIYKHTNASNDQIFKCFKTVSTNSCVITDVDPDRQYSFAVCSCDSNGVDSKMIFNNWCYGSRVNDSTYFSNMISANISQNNNSLQFTWTKFDDINYNSGYSLADTSIEVYSKKHGDEQPVLTVDNLGNKTSYKMTTKLTKGDTYYYKLTLYIGRHWYFYTSPSIVYTGESSEKVEPTEPTQPVKPTEPPVKPTQPTTKPTAEPTKPTEVVSTTPVISSVSSNGEKITVKWNLVSGATSYNLFYKSNKSWVRIGTTASTECSFYGTKGSTYYLMVRALKNNAYIGTFDSVGFKYVLNVDTPQIISVSNKDGKIKISWRSVQGGTCYRVFSKTSLDQKWTGLGNTTNTSYVYSGKPSQKYYFTLRCVTDDGKEFMSDYNRTGYAYTHMLTAPKLASVVTTSPSGAVLLKWNKVAGATYYQTFYKKSSGSWKKYNRVTTTSTTIKGLSNNQKYIFTVRCVSKDSKVWYSGYDSTGISVKYYKIPALKSFKYYSPKTGMIKWDAVSGVSKYIVYYKKDNGGWKRYKVVSTNSCRIGTLYKGYKYTVTVKCSDKNGNAISYHNTKGLSLKW